MKFVFVLVFLIIAPALAGTADTLRDIGIDQKLNQRLPRDISFTDECGNPVLLGDFFVGKPVLLVPVYYRCPMLCSMTLNGLSRALCAMKESAGQEFQIVVFSIDPNEKSDLAAAKKLTYLRGYRRPSAEVGWRFLTGDARSIASLTSAIGFRYKWDESSKTFAHSAGAVMVTSGGKISRYFDGAEFEPAEISAAILTASAERSQSLASRVLIYCFSYDPQKGRLGFIIMRTLQALALLTLAILAIFIGVSVLKERRGQFSST